MIRLTIAVLSGAAALWAGVAGANVPPALEGPEPGPDTPACVQANRIRSWSEIDDRHIYVSMMDKRRRFLVTFLGPCKEAKWATIMHLARGSVTKCLWAGDTLIFRTTPWSAGESCWISKVEPAPPPPADEEAAPQKRMQQERPPVF